MRNWIDLFESDPYMAHYGVPEAVVRKYSEGECLYLALAMNIRFGWPIWCQMDSDLRYIAHAYCEMPDGREIDILGPQDQVDRYDDHLVQWSRERMEKHIAGGPNLASIMDDASKAIDTYIVPRL